MAELCIYQVPLVAQWQRISPDNAGAMGLIPGAGRSLEKETALYSVCLENPKDRGAWRKISCVFCIVHCKKVRYDLATNSNKTTRVSHIFFICVSFCESLGCFRVLSLINNAAMNMEVHISF